MPKVSVIIPSFNCERYIKQTIDSVLAQTIEDLELIVVDDGSTDATPKIVASYGGRVRLVAQQNSRVSGARNRGIREAKGEFICLMDHDDYWFPHKLSRQLAEFEARPEAGVVYSSFIRWHAAADGRFPDPDGYDLSEYPDDIDPVYSGWIYHQFLLDCWMLTSTTMFRAEVFERCGAFDESLPYSEDWELWLRIAREYPIIQLRRPTTLYRQHPRQGNRLVRDLDYRTLLLMRTVKEWGLCSKDGRCVSRRRFLRQLAQYHAAFGLLHLQAGHVRVAVDAFRRAWFTYPLRIKYLAYITAALGGWRPGW